MHCFSRFPLTPLTPRRCPGSVTLSSPHPRFWSFSSVPTSEHLLLEQVPCRHRVMQKEHIKIMVQAVLGGVRTGSGPRSTSTSFSDCLSTPKVWADTLVSYSKHPLLVQRSLLPCLAPALRHSKDTAQHPLCKPLLLSSQRRCPTADAKGLKALTSSCSSTDTSG